MITWIKINIHQLLTFIIRQKATIFFSIEKASYSDWGSWQLKNSTLLLLIIFSYNGIPGKLQALFENVLPHRPIVVSSGWNSRKMANETFFENSGDGSGHHFVDPFRIVHNCIKRNTLVQWIRPYRHHNDQYVHLLWVRPVDFRFRPMRALQKSGHRHYGCIS